MRAEQRLGVFQPLLDHRADDQGGRDAQQRDEDDRRRPADFGGARKSRMLPQHRQGHGADGHQHEEHIPRLGPREQRTRHPGGLLIGVDDRWNPTDANKTAEVVIKAVLSKNWLAEYQKTNGGKKPYVIVDEIENRTSEHIDTAALGSAMQNELINSGKIGFVDARARERILKEIKYHQESGMVNQKSAKQKGKQTGADFLMVGDLTSIVSQDRNKGYSTVTYTTTVRLTNLETSEILFSESYQIKKKFKRSSW